MRCAVYTIDRESGDTREIAQVPDLAPPLLSPDGEYLFFYDITRHNILKTRLENRDEEVVYQGEHEIGHVGNLSLSPDGHWLALFETASSLVILSSGGGSVRQIVRLETTEENPFSDLGSGLFVSWSPDGEYILFPKRGRELWRVHVESREQQKLGLVDKNLCHAVMHPDGRRIAYSTRAGAMKLWVTEDFLPGR